MHSTTRTTQGWPAIAGLFAALVATQVFAQGYVPPYVVPGQRVDRACSSSAFTLEVPLWRPGLPAGFETAFASALPLSGDWFGCPTCSFRVKLTAVLADYSNTTLHPAVPAARRDGHRRSFIVSFQKNKGSAVAPSWVTARVTNDQACRVVSSIRNAATAALGMGPIGTGLAAQPFILVSRSCDVLVQDAEGHVPVSTAIWADQRIKAQPTPGLAKVDVALVDTGVPEQFRVALGVVSENPLPAFEGMSAAFHPHGARMAALIHAVAPHAQLRSYRALDANGMGSLESLARATDDALFDNGWTASGRRPLVVNLSVGAPPDFFSPALLAGAASCRTWEDGGGELLRYVFSIAGRIDQQGKAVFIAAAAGNSLLERASTTAAPWVGGVARTPCSLPDGGAVDAAPGVNPSSFLPAGFGERLSCRSIYNDKVWLPVLPVGASTFDDRRSMLTQRGAEPRLYAPGERVFASNSGLLATPPTIACSPGDLSLFNGFETPATVSGTSASTAFVSAAAAHLLARNLPLNGGWRAADLARLLFLTGEPLCETGFPLPGRRLSIKRADQVVTSGSMGCLSLLTCLRSAALASGPLLSDSTGAVCASAMSDCLGTEAVLACAPPLVEPGWAASQLTSAQSAPLDCRAAWNVPAVPTPRRLTGPNASFPDVQLAGLGPQPSGSGCPNCSVVLSSADWLFVQFELSDEFPEYTRILDGHLIILDLEKRPVASAQVSDGNEWRPGEVGKLEIREFLDPSGEVAVDRRELIERLWAGDWVPLLDLAVDVGGNEGRLVSTLRIDRLETAEPVSP